MKHCIIIIGNIGAGKSTLTQALASVLDKAVCVSLDDSRLEVCEQNMGNNSKHSDMIAQELCIEKLCINDFVLFETTGVSRFYSRAIKEMVSEGYKLTKVMLDCNQDTCWSRYQARKTSGHIMAPFAYKKGKNIREAIRHIHWEQKKLEVDHRFSAVKLKTEQITEQLIKLI